MAKQITNIQETSFFILRRREVEARTGLGCSTIYDGIKAGTFPAPIQLGPKSVGWVESEINAWLADRAEARDQAAKSAALARQSA